MILNFLKAYVRTLWRNKIYSFINVIGLSIATACAMLIVLYASDEVSYDRFHENGKNIYRIVHKRLNPDGSVQNTGGNTGYLQGPAFQSDLPEIETYVRLKSYNREIRNGAEIFNGQVHFTDPGFFNVFSFPLIHGDAQTVLMDVNSVVVSESMAKRLFGTTDVVGKTIEIKKNDIFELHDITGVAKDAPDNSSIKFDLVAQMVPVTEDLSWGSYFLNTFVVLKPGTDVTGLESKIKSIYEREAKNEIRDLAERFGVTGSIVHVLQPYADIHLSLEYPADNGMADRSSPMYAYVLSAIALFILLIACINFVNLTIARSIRRAREIGIRKIVGSNKKQLIIQFLAESYLICVIAFVISIGIVQTVLPSFNTLSNKQLYISYLLETGVLGMIVALFAATGLLTGAYPSFVLSGFNPVKALRNKLSISGGGVLQRSLVVFQFALATLLMICTITIFLQFDYLTNQPLGYDDSDVVIVPKQGLTHHDARLLKEQLLASPEIIAVSMKSGGREGTRAKTSQGTEVGFDYETVDPSYISLYKISLIAGRDFSPEFPADSNHSVIVNESMVKQAGWTDPIGETLDFWYRNEKYTVIGVVKDYHFLSMNRESGSLVLTMRASRDYGMALARIKPGAAPDALGHIENTFRKLFPESTYEYTFKEAENYRSYAAEARWKKIMLAGAAVTIFLSCIGLFGLTIVTAEKRMKEIGIRKVLGASVVAAVALITKDFLKLVFISMVIAIPAAWMLITRWLEGYPYHISLGWTIFASGALLMIVISLATVSFQAFKTALSNPVDSLRNE